MTKKNLITTLSVVAVVLIAIAAMWQKNKTENKLEVINKQPESKTEIKTEEQNKAAMPETEKPKEQATEKPKAPVQPKATYGELVQQYEGRRIQFDDSCQAKPAQSTYKLGTSLMFDNRSAKPRKFIVDGKTYNVLAYGWQIVNFNSLGIRFVDCDAYQNVNTITIQK